jgi:hypothetical protein
MLNELRQEAETTKRLLDRIPENELQWRPIRSQSLGQLALHIAKDRESRNKVPAAPS